jgi:hypothetical protein
MSVAALRTMLARAGDRRLLGVAPALFSLSCMLQS